MDTDEFDSLATLHGILCAFLLSISIGVQISLSAENTGYITFCAALAKQQGFRTLVHSHLNKTELEYDWDFLVSPGVIVNGEYELLEGIVNRHPLQKIYPNSGDELKPLEKILKTDINLRMLCVLLYDDFPQKYTSAYLIQNPNAYRIQYNSQLAATSTALLIAGLVSNVILYIGFLLSPSREEKTGGAAVAFKTIGLPLLYFQYATLIAAIGAMSYASSFVLVYNTPFVAVEWDINFMYYTCMAYGPPILLSLPITMCAWYRSAKEANARDGGSATIAPGNERTLAI